MQLKNCIECGKVFVHPTMNICSECYEEEEKDFEKVKEYLWDKASASIDEIHKMTGVSKKRIIKFIKSGRITAGELNFENVLTCESCGEPIKEGRYCKKCSERLFKGLTEGLEEKKVEKSDTRKSAKMYTAEWLRKE
ncbi:hypothetical protein BBF96_11195 [Anoxybacter fermentans]|uniref:Flagellar protein n=1 Tax=Anoxybacter fermentans TaxID=1323375 RepID=A0A3S9T065_9FIRM|nr:TIGR03826 family flagellar region protein [Anoxybacter fermentans]AZR73905.1 hypothetical protein BBF96_11195 [Anoxybacter fermentans]